MAVSGLVPGRFLTITAHVVVLICIMFSREENVKACLPLDYTDEEYDQKDTQLIIGISMSLCFAVIEYVGFFGGLTTFLPTPALISTCLHAAACVALAFFIWDVWDCDYFWYIFVFCSAIPGLMEIAVIIGVVALKNI